MLKIRMNWDEYMKYLKKKEISRIFPVKGVFFDEALEIGAGDGYQSILLAKYCKKIICSEYNEKRLQKRNVRNIEYEICDVEKLPFKNKSFDLVFSSSVLEHLPNRNKAMNELHRVLRDNGMMIHIMPSRIWKFLDFTFYHFNLFIKLIEGNLFEKKYSSNVKSKSVVVKSNGKILLVKKILRNLWPAVHGEYRSNLEEFIAFGKKDWVKLFEKNGYKVIQIKNVVLCSGYGFGFNRLRFIGEKLGFYSTNAYYVVKKINSNYKKFDFIKSG